MILVLITACVALAIAGGWRILRRAPYPGLPPAVRDERLPQEFSVALDRARADVERAPQRAEPVRRLASLYQANGLLAEARACYQRIAELESGLSAQDHYALADLALGLGDLETAKIELTRTLEREPNYLPAQIRLGEAFFKTGELDSAGKAYASALQVQADQPQAVVGLARCELQRGDDDAAVTRLERLVADRPESAAAAGLLAQILERRGHPDR
ncbi:MAG: tetratricopeptide repeat protein, partial [Opitutus sp.]